MIIEVVEKGFEQDELMGPKLLCCVIMYVYTR
jgi:hypothetical protein